MDRTNCRSTPTKNQAVLQHLYLLPINHYEKMEQEEIHLLTKYQPSTIHYIELSIVEKLALVK
jgi:hypothetical protein